VYSGRFEGNASGNDGGGVYTGIVALFQNTEVVNNTAGGDGGGLHAYFRAEGIRDDLFQGNVAQNRGGGLYAALQWMNVDSSRFISNTADLGGGIAGEGTSGSTGGSIVNSVFSRNSAVTEGSDVHYQHARPLKIVHSSFVDVTDSGQRSIVIYTATVEITNTLVTSYLVGIDNRSGVVTLTNNLFFNDTSPWLGSNIAETGSIFGDPMFVDSPTDDFRLVIGSAALEAGADAGVTVDILGMPRPNGVGFDIGAYEGAFTPTAVTLRGVTVGDGYGRRWFLLPSLLLLLALMVVRRRSIRHFRQFLS
jgi:hypothetical protein